MHPYHPLTLFIEAKALSQAQSSLIRYSKYPVCSRDPVSIFKWCMLCSIRLVEHHTYLAFMWVLKSKLVFTFVCQEIQLFSYIPVPSFSDRASLCIPDWLPIHNPPISVFGVLKLKRYEPPHPVNIQFWLRGSYLFFVVFKK